MLTKPSPAIHKYTLDASSGSDAIQIATSAREVVSILATGGGGGVAAVIYDSANGPGDPKEAIYISANAGESTPFTPSQPILFKKGIYAVLEQGGDPFNGKVFISIN